MNSEEKTLKLKYTSPPNNYPLSRHRTHGLSQNVSWAQVLSSLVVISEIVVYFSCVIQMHTSITILVLYVISGLIGIVTAMLATFHNPTDWIVYYYKSSDYKKDGSFKYNLKEARYCSFCDSYCYKNSKHCKECNR